MAATVQMIQRSAPADLAASSADEASAGPLLDSPRDHETAYDLLDRAVSAFDGLTRRTQQLEADLAEARAKLTAESARMEEMTANWARLSEGMRAHAHEREQRLAETTTRAEAAETKLAETVIRAEASELRCAELQNRSTRLHDKVVASFGIGSKARLTLDSLAAGERAVPAAAH